MENLRQILEAGLEVTIELRFRPRFRFVVAMSF